MKTRLPALLLCALLACNTSAPPRPDQPSSPPVEIGPESVGGGKADFNWGNGCECDQGGNGSFTQNIAHNAIVQVGKIPVGIVDVEIKLTSDEDVDIQLYAGDTKIVGYPDGTLNGDARETTTHNGVTVVYSGYNGDGTNLGHEYIKIQGMLIEELTMKAYGYAAGNAQVDYSWSDRKWCGFFEKQVADEARVTLGTIPQGLKNIHIKLDSPVDIDVELYDGSTKVVGWDGGVIESDTRVSGTYRGVTIEWSGYNGDGTNLGNEYIKIAGTTQNAYKMKVYGYAPGTAKVFYKWEEASEPPPEPYRPFSQRLSSFKQKYSSRVVVAKRRGDPVLFLKTSDLSLTNAAGRDATKKFYNDLYKMLGSNSLMLWNPAGKNMGHVAMGISASNPALDAKYQGKAVQAYNRAHIYDISLGNMDDYCYGDHTSEEGNGTIRWYNDACKKPYDLTNQRTVLALKLTNVQLTEWNAYLDAIVSDFRGALGQTRCNGGVPTYILNSLSQSVVNDLSLSSAETNSHNCTSWFTAWTFANLDHTMYYNPADMLRGYWGIWSDPAPSNLRAWLVFNHPDTPSANTNLSTSFDLRYGH